MKKKKEKRPIDNQAKIKKNQALKQKKSKSTVLKKGNR